MDMIKDLLRLELVKRLVYEYRKLFLWIFLAIAGLLTMLTVYR